MNCVCLIWYLQYLNDWDVGRECWIWDKFGKISDLGWISDNFGWISDEFRIKGHVIWMLQSNRLRVLCLSTVSHGLLLNAYLKTKTYVNNFTGFNSYKIDASILNWNKSIATFSNKIFLFWCDANTQRKP